MSSKTLILALFLHVAIQAQSPPVERPQEAARKQADELVREAKTIYGVSVLRQRGDRLLEALKLLEKAAKLDPEATEPRRGLIPIYLVLGREEDAIDACRFVLQRDPADCQTAHEFGKLLKAIGKPREAAEVLGRGLESKQIADLPDLHYRMLSLRADVLEKIEDDVQAAATLKRLGQLLVRERVTLVNHEVVSLDGYAVVLARTYEREGMCYVHRHNFDEAIKVFLKARDFLRDQPEVEIRLRAVRILWQLAEVEYARDHLQDALGYLNNYLDHNPLHIEAYERKVAILDKFGRMEEILRSLGDYGRQMPDYLPVQLLLARELTRDRQNWVIAEDKYKKLAERFPAAEVYRGWFKLMRSQGQIDKVLDMLDEVMGFVYGKDEVEIAKRESAAKRGQAMLQALRAEPSLVHSLLVANSTPPRVREYVTWYFLADLAVKTRQLDRAEAFLSQSLLKVPVSQQIYVYDALINVLHRLHKTEAVVELCQSALRREVGEAFFHEKLALALSEQGKDNEAIQHARMAVKYASNKKIHEKIILAQLLATADKYELAVAECEDMLKEFTNATDVRSVRNALARVHQMKGQKAKAEEEYQKILKDDPNDPLTNNNLGYDLAERNVKLDEAERLIRRAIEVDGVHRKLQLDDEQENAAYLDSLAWVLFRKGKHQQALEIMERVIAMEQETASGEIWDHLGDIYAQVKQPAKAIEAWKKAAKNFGHERRWRKLGRVEATLKKIEQVSAP
jgi:tetratricopeptide (TPR) repeat protein